MACWLVVWPHGRQWRRCFAGQLCLRTPRQLPARLVAGAAVAGAALVVVCFSWCLMGRSTRGAGPSGLVLVSAWQYSGSGAVLVDACGAGVELVCSAWS